MFKYTLDNKRYHTLNYYNKSKYGCKVFKVSLNAGFSCPNKKNGTGCIYCYNGSGENDGMDLLTQFNKVRDNNLRKWPNAKYIGYFQAGTNTYADVNTLKSKYEPILKLDNVIGLNIATRCDALNSDVLDYLEDLNNRTDLIVELGLQTIHESTSKLINRGHTLEQFEEAVLELRKRNINVVVHIINGLPFETKEMMLSTIKYLNKLDIQGIKIHMLFILKDTPILNLYNTTNFHILSKEEYIDIVIDQLELLRPEIVIHRITGDPIKELLIEPTWLLKKFSVLDDIDKEMVKRDSYQGKRIQ
ncbi:MAG: TIGR01212 family radical SAM protein [Mollicutes bacterium]|nr:TIGR01212 family radical SAM protein [Mollicutes bacterium]